MENHNKQNNPPKIDGAKNKKGNSRKEDSKSSKFTGVLKSIFVKNIGYKIAAIVISVSLWILTAGLS